MARLQPRLRPPLKESQPISEEWLRFRRHADAALALPCCIVLKTGLRNKGLRGCFLARPLFSIRPFDCMKITVFTGWKAHPTCMVRHSSPWRRCCPRIAEVDRLASREAQNPCNKLPLEYVPLGR